MNVVRRRESFSSGICQNPLLASSLLNTVAPASWASLINFRNWVSFTENTLVQRLEVDTYPDLPRFFGTTTIPAHQGVGSSTFKITPSVSMWSSFSWTFARRGIGMFRAVWIVCGTASSFSLNLYSSLMVPSPWKTPLNLSLILWLLVA